MDSKDLVEGVDWKFPGEMEFELKNSNPAYVSMVHFIILKVSELMAGMSMVDLEDSTKDGVTTVHVWGLDGNKHGVGFISSRGRDELRRIVEECPQDMEEMSLLKERWASRGFALYGGRG